MKETLLQKIAYVLFAVIIVSIAYYSLKPIVETRVSTVSKKDRANCEYQVIMEDDSLIVFDGERLVGKIKSNGEIDSLIIKDNL